MPLSLAASGHTLRQVLIVSDHNLSQAKYSDLSPEQLEECKAKLDNEEGCKEEDIRAFYSFVKSEVECLLQSKYNENDTVD